MLTDNDAMATIAVRNMAAARNFYEGKLHFKRSGGNDQGVATYSSGNSTVLIYESQYAGTNKATSATWSVGRCRIRALRSARSPARRRHTRLREFQSSVVQGPRRQHSPRQQRLTPARRRACVDDEARVPNGRGLARQTRRPGGEACLPAACPRPAHRSAAIRAKSPRTCQKNDRRQGGNSVAGSPHSHDW